MTWEWQVAIDLWLAGLAGGAYFTAFLADRFSGGKHEEWVRIATYLGVPAALIGSLVLAMDLGEQFRAWHLFIGLSPSSWQVVSTYGAASLRTWPPFLNLYPISPMSLGSWILLFWSLIGVALIALWFAKAFESVEEANFFGTVASALRPFLPALNVLKWIAFALSVLLITYTGVLLSATNKGLWANAFPLPALFVASASLTGIAAILIIMSTAIGPSLRTLFGTAGEATTGEAVATLGKAGAVVILIEIVALALYLLWIGLLSGPAGAQAIGVLLSGSLAVPFWGGVVVLGLLIPLALEANVLRTRKEPPAIVLTASALCVLLGGFILRMVVVIGGQL
jgi:polysulfide reductase chain C